MPDPNRLREGFKSECFIKLMDFDVIATRALDLNQEVNEYIILIALKCKNEF